MIEWLTTTPNPVGTSSYGGRRGWRLHAVDSYDRQFHGPPRALCGLTPEHGWSEDPWMGEKCARCEKQMKGAK